MKQNTFPPGWDEERVKRVLTYHEAQTEEAAAAEDEAAFWLQVSESSLAAVWNNAEDDVYIETARTVMTTANIYLDKLVGQWELTGQMGQTPLRQAAEARWVLGGLFVQVTFKSTLPVPEGQKPYEAIYHIGYNQEEDVYVMHLLDTFGVATACIVSIGRREGDSILFVFAYEGDPFTNRFTWDAAAEVWIFEQTYVEDGRTHTFATKRMVRSA